MKSQAEKGERFRELHRREGIFLIPNPWDVGSARLLQHLGFEALATTSSGFAASIGRRDNQAGREQVIEHARALCAATDVPVSADLENGFGDSPEIVSETIRLAAGAGLAGASIEDATERADDPIYDRALSVERVRAAVEAKRALSFDFTLTARAENFVKGRHDLGDTIARLQAYQDAGADVLFAPGVSRLEDIATVVRSVDRPVNVLAGTQGFTVAQLAEVGVKRISVGGGLARLALGALVRGAREMRERGTFTFATEALSPRELADMLAG